MGLYYVARHKPWVRYVVLTVSVLGGGLLWLLLSVPSQRARYWKPLSSSSGATATDKVSYDGGYALRVESGVAEEGMLGQSLLMQTALDLRGRIAVLSAQVRADAGEHYGGLAVVDLDRGTRFRTDFTVGPQWGSVELQFVVPDDASHLQVVLIAAPQSVLYYDQVALTEGSNPGRDIEPLRNGSGENIRSLGEIILVGAGKSLGFGGVLQMFFASWQSNLGKLLANPRPIWKAFESFWGNFGAALVVPLLPPTYQILKYTCLLGVLGLGVYMYRTWTAKREVCQTWQRHSLVVLGVAVVFACSLAFAPLLTSYDYWGPQGRYLFPVVWPFAVFLVIGWAELMPRSTRPWLLVGLIGGMTALDCVAIWRLMSYFYGI